MEPEYTIMINGTVTEYNDTRAGYNMKLRTVLDTLKAAKAWAIVRAYADDEPIFAARVIGGNTQPHPLEGSE